MQVQPDPLPSPSPPTPSLQIFPEDPCNSYPCSSVYNPLQNPTSTLGFTLFCCLWFPANLIQYTLVYRGMAVFLLLGVFWASWSMVVWCVFYILKSHWPLLLQKKFFFAPFTYPSFSDALITHVLHLLILYPISWLICSVLSLLLIFLFVL